MRIARGVAVAVAALGVVATGAPATEASLRTVERVATSNYGRWGRCLAVAASGRAHVLIGERALERRPGGRFEPSRFSQDGAAPCGVAYSRDGDLIAAYDRFLYDDYRDGEVYELGYEWLRPHQRSRGPRIAVEEGAEGSPPETPLLADAGGAAMVVTTTPSDVTRAVALRRHGSVREVRRIRWPTSRRISVERTTAAAAARGTAVVALLDRSNASYDVVERRAVVSTRGRAGAFSRPRTALTGVADDAEPGVTVAARGTVVVAVPLRGGRIGVAVGRIGGPMRPVARQWRGDEARLVADGAGALLAYTRCGEERCTVFARTVAATGRIGRAIRLARVDVGEPEWGLATGDGGRAAFWWIGARRLRVKVRPRHERPFARAATLSTQQPQGVALSWGRRSELLATWQTTRGLLGEPIAQVAVALRSR